MRKERSPNPAIQLHPASLGARRRVLGRAHMSTGLALVVNRSGIIALELHELFALTFLTLRLRAQMQESRRVNEGEIACVGCEDALGERVVADQPKIHLQISHNIAQASTLISACTTAQKRWTYAPRLASRVGALSSWFCCLHSAIARWILTTLDPWSW